MKVKTCSAFLLLLTLLGGAAGAVDTIELGEISVTGTRTARKVQDVPASIEIITEENIAHSVAATPDELLEGVSGVYLKDNVGFMSTRASVLMRGFGGSLGSTRTLLLVDGVPMNSIYSGRADWNQVPMNAIERLEVVKGAGSSLYGSNAMGGVVNIITKIPEKRKTEIGLGYGSMETKLATAATMGKIDRFGYYLAGRALKTDGYVTETAENIFPNTVDTGIERLNAAVKLSYEIDETASLAGGFFHLEESLQGRLAVDDYDPQDQKIQTFHLNYEKNFANFAILKAVLFHKRSDSQYDSLDFRRTSVAYLNDAETSENGGTVQYSHPLAAQVLTLGADFKYGEAESIDRYAAGSLEIATEGKQDYYALFFQDEIFFGEKLIINFGGRFDQYENHAGKRVDEVNNLYADHPDRDFSSFSPKAGAVYKFNDNTSVRGSVAKAFRAPSIYEVYGDYVMMGMVFAGNPDLEPEEVVAYEIGLDHKLDKKGLVSLTAYYNDAEDFIYSITPLDPASTNFKEKTNVGEVRILGVEAEVSYAFNARWKALATLTYNESTIESFDPDPSLEGNRLTEIPREKATLSLVYRNPDLMDVTTTARYVGSRYADDANTEKLDSYTLVDIKLVKKLSGRMEASLAVNDLFDEGYTVSSRYVSPGRVIMGNLQVTF